MKYLHMYVENKKTIWNGLNQFSWWNFMLNFSVILDDDSKVLTHCGAANHHLRVETMLTYLSNPHNLKMGILPLTIGHEIILRLCNNWEKAWVYSIQTCISYWLYNRLSMLKYGELVMLNIFNSSQNDASVIAIMPNKELIRVVNQIWFHHNSEISN